MPPKAKSDTKSSTSATNSSETPVQFVKGVGPRLGAIFKSRGIETVRDLLFFFPRAYEDRTRFAAIRDLQEGVQATTAVRVIGVNKIPLRASGRSILEVRCTDETGILSLKWFHAPRGIENRFKAGTQIIVTGTVKIFRGKPEIAHPEITWGLSTSTDTTTPDESASSMPHVGRIVPVYTEIEGVPSRLLRKILWEALQKFLTTLEEDLPTSLREAHGLPSLQSAIRAIHFPEEGGDKPETIAALVAFNSPSHWRLIYEEFFKFEYLVLRQRLRMEKEHARVWGKNGGAAATLDLTQKLPFALTKGQNTCVREILEDLEKPHPMNRLIQGDVGSGKTAVVFLCAAAVIAEGGQATLMAPTEILAEQHYINAGKLFDGKLNVALLTGKSTTAERNALFDRLARGEPLLLIGTHALIEDPVVFKNLSFVIIDEQHRFGVEQRRILRQKGFRVDPETGLKQFPHSLSLSATPIPRTLALTVYGDLTVSSIREMPPGRSPVITKVVREKKDRTDVYEHIRAQLQTGRQAYFIFPLIHESEAEGFTQLKAAAVEAERIGREIFPEYKIGLLHGQQKNEEKAAIMARFKKNELQILVSTTVVEVGVDVPNATIIAIEHAERFGLSQLHQLRGRVGRGQHQSFCYLFAATRTTEATASRLEVLEETHDGFRIAEADLEIRGPGAFLGTRQAGSLPFFMADVVRDKEWLFKSRDDAVKMLKEDPSLERPEHAPLKRYFDTDGGKQFAWLKTS